MIFGDVVLRRFKRISGEVTLGLKPGINVLRGDNDSGKTSSIEGLTLAVTGFTEAGSKLADFVNNNSGSKTYEILVPFVQDGADYALTLQAGIERTKKTIARNGELLAEGATAVDDVIATLIDTNLALYGSIALQHRTTSVIFDDPAPRLQKLKSMLGMDTVSRAVELLKDRVKTSKDQAAETRAVLKTLQAMTFEDKLLPESEEDPGVVMEFQNAQADYETYLQLREAHVKAIAAVDRQRQEFEKAKQAYENQCQTYEKARNAVAAKASAIVQEQAKLVAVAEIQPLETEERQAALRIGQIQTEIVSCETRLALIAAGKCSQCAQDYIGDPLPLQEQIQNLRAELQVLQPSVKVLGAEIKTLRAAYTKNQQAVAVVQRAEADLQALRKELQALPEPGDAPVQAPLAYPPAPEFDMNAYRELERRARAYQAFERELRAAMDFNQAQHEQRQKNAENIETRTAELEALTQAQTVAEKSRGLLEKEFSAFLLESGLAFVEKRMNEFFVRFSDHRVSIRRDHKSVEFFFSTDGGEQFTPAVLLGGAYRQILSMAFRLALCALQESEFIILDEVDASTTEDNSAKLFANAVAFAPGIKQWIIVTHRQDTVDMLVSDFGANVIELKNGEVV